MRVGSPFLCVCYLFFFSCKLILCSVWVPGKDISIVYVPEGDTGRVWRERGNTRIFSAPKEKVRGVLPSRGEGRRPPFHLPLVTVLPGDGERLGGCIFTGSSLSILNTTK